jgi:benzoyl-CoA reductase subunit B
LNYWGSIILNKFVLSDGRIVEWPPPDFMWTIQTCCQHAKWYQVAGELEEKIYKKKIPLYAVDVPVGSFMDPPEIKKSRVEYVVNQLKDGIEWLEKVTGRNISESRLIDNIKTEIEATHLWAKICELNQNSPAPLDERAIYALFAFGPMNKHDKRTLEFYKKLYEEVKERVKNNIGMIEGEKARVVSNSNPPWFATYIWRRLEEKGCIPVGSLYTFGLIGCWEVEDGKLKPRTLPWEKGININDMDTALWALVDWTMNGRIMWQVAHDFRVYVECMDMLAEQWGADAIILHYNKGCEYFAFGVPELKRQLSKRGYKVFNYEGSMANPLDVTIDKIYAVFDTVAESLGL